MSAESDEKTGTTTIPDPVKVEGHLQKKPTSSYSPYAHPSTHGKGGRSGGSRTSDPSSIPVPAGLPPGARPVTPEMLAMMDPDMRAKVKAMQADGARIRAEKEQKKKMAAGTGVGGGRAAFSTGMGGKGMTRLPPDHPAVQTIMADGKKGPDSETRRQKYRDDGRVIYEWEQTLEDLIVYISLPKGIRGRDISCTITPRHMVLKRKKSSAKFIDEDFCYIVKPDASFWNVSDGLLEINLTKQELGQTWPAVFKRHMNQKMNAWEEQNAKKAMMLERFQRENPHFDFSNAKFTGHNVPEASKFMGGIDSSRFT